MCGQQLVFRTHNTRGARIDEIGHVNWYFEIKKENSGPELHFYLNNHRSVNKLKLNPVFYTSIESGLINVFIIIPVYNIYL